MPPIILNPLMFRAYDIRGTVGDDLTPAVAERIGRAYGTYLVRQYDVHEIVAGRDNRPSSVALRDGFVEGVRAAGVSVVDIGLAPSPLLYFAAAHWGLDGGVSVTGSHNPTHMNGMKLLERRGISLAPDEIQRVREIAQGDDFEGGRGALSERDPKPEYWDLLTRRFALPRRIKVVTDAGNAVATLTGPEALRRIGCDVVELFAELDGTFPHHLPDPQVAETMTALRAAVLQHGADLGVAWDGDGDRFGLVNERGVRYQADEILAVLARDLLARRPGERVLVDVKTSLTAVDDIRSRGGVPVFAPTGHSLGKRKMRDEGILLGGEGSAHYYFAEDYYGLDDAVFAACLFARMLAADDQPLSAHFQGLRAFVTSPELKLPCPDRAKFRVAAEITAHFRDLYSVMEIDGARIDFDDGWALVRASNTGPVLSVRIEAQSRDRYDAIRAIIWDALAQHPEVTIPEGVGEPAS